MKKRREISNLETITLPENFVCPVCGERLKVWLYKGKDEQVKGYPMMGCRNWRGKCSSPWRNHGNRIPWHVWIGFSDDGKIIEKLNSLEHKYPKEDKKRYRLLRKIMRSLKKTDLRTYYAICDLYKRYKDTQNKK